MSEDDNSPQMTAASPPSSDGRPSVAPQTRPPYEVYSQPLEDRDHAKRELMALVDGTPNFEPHYYAVCKSGLAIAVNIGGLNAAQDIPFLAHAANCHRYLLEALKAAADQFEFYGREHRKKQRGAEFNGIEAFIKEPREKAETNERFAAMCRAAIAKASAPIGSETSENKPGV